ncbi:MAG: PQQ-binding-like beta-propeller repeat protein [Bacteroidales bacterium]|nr:PQQ-binding-like beta-propeller repeat protein [Bacteroidales bacterium]MBN2632112.1 PQQ-binding-like beta-propeller repeat protein [Bacteroidales bacterium]
MSRRLLIVTSLVFAFSVSSAQSSDWPMWRCDHHRSASTPEQLAEKLYLQWQVNFSPREPVWDDPLNQNLMQFDRIFEPVVADNKLFLGFNDRDKVVAFDLVTGDELWHYYADGPVRLPLAYNRGILYFTGDDGFCYALEAKSGTLVWKSSLAPAPDRLLGNKRLISMWPARGGIVVKDDIIYTAASIFPLMGTYIYALNAADGSAIWKNEATGSNYILQPHRSPAFADVAPQGPFAITGNVLLVAGGRSVPAAFDLNTGEELYYQLAPSGKTGGAFTTCNDKVFFNHHRERVVHMYSSGTGDRLRASAGEYPVIDGDTVYFSGKHITAAITLPDSSLKSLWSVNIRATTDLIKAGNTLFAADSTGISAVTLKPGSEPELTWRYDSDRIIERLVAANGKLVAVTSDGSVMVFGDRPAEEVAMHDKKVVRIKGNSKAARKILNTAAVSEGYAVVFGSDVKLLEGLVVNSMLSIVAYIDDAAKINLLREYFDERDIEAQRLSFLPYYPSEIRLPKYFSSLTVIAEDYGYDDDFLKMLYESVRPYGGRIITPGKGKVADLFARLELTGSRSVDEKGLLTITRPGALEGAGSWTHNYGDIENTVKSDDRLVKAPLGILWFGGNSNMDVLPRHGHGPGEQVIDGRLIIEGVNSISARDVYTGRVLWKRESQKLMDDSWMVFYDDTYDEEHPLDPKYNQVHLPGANARGTNFIATGEYVYLIEGNKCILLDMETGNPVREFSTGDDDTKELGYIGVWENMLILGNNFTEYTGLENDSIRIKNPKFTDYDHTASHELIVMNRFTGEKLWSMESNFGFIHNSVIAGDGILFCLDKLPQYLETKLRRRGEPIPEGSRLLYVDIATGRILREQTEDVFGTWLGYSSGHKLLLQATRPSRDMLNGEEGNRMIAYNIDSGKEIWDRAVRYSNPPIIHNDRIYTNGEAFSLLTGDQILERDPLTGEELKWNFKREYGCGIVAASEHLLTFRSASAGFMNLETFEGTASLGGWKPGCSTNLIAADGVLNSPDYTRTCQCPYQNQTSLALIHMPWMSYWTNSNYRWNGKRIKQMGINFNAPGDRRADNDVMWFEYPFVSGLNPEIKVSIDTAEYFSIRKEPYSVSSQSTPWISSSAAGGIRTLEITLSEEEDITDAVYSVNLYFSELQDKKEGDRLCDVAIQNRKVLGNFDIVKEAGACNKEVVKSFKGIKAGRTLRIELTPLRGNTLISGVEIIEESLVSTR